MSEFRMWLFRMVVISILCAVAQELMPTGGVKRAGKLVCGLMVMWVMLSPLTRWIHLPEGSFELPGQTHWEEQTIELERQVMETRKTIIEERCAAYIVDKAEQLGVSCKAEVSCTLGEEGLYLPRQARMTGEFSDVAQSQMTQLLQEELEIPGSRQEYILEEVPG